MTTLRVKRMKQEPGLSTRLLSSISSNWSNLMKVGIEQMQKRQNNQVASWYGHNDNRKRRTQNLVLSTPPPPPQSTLEKKMCVH